MIQIKILDLIVLLIALPLINCINYWAKLKLIYICLGGQAVLQEANKNEISVIVML